MMCGVHSCSDWPRGPSWRSWGPSWPVFLAVAILLSAAPMASATEVSESDLARLEAIFSELRTEIAQLRTDLAVSKAALKESTDSLEKARASLSAYVAEAEAALRATRAERDGWRVATAATGVVGILAVIVTLVLRL
jgi:multidrug resistance efflux pump